MFEIYFELGGLSKNRSSILRGVTVLNSISLMNISKYFRFAKELALYQNDNYVESNENALISIWMQHTRLSRSARKPDAARI